MKFRCNPVMFDNVIAHLKSWRAQLAPRSGGEPNAEIATLLRETDSREHWLEATIDGEPVRPLPGSVLIEP